MNEKLWQAIIKGLESIASNNPDMIKSLADKAYVSEAIPIAAEAIYNVLNELSVNESNNELQSLESLIFSLLDQEDKVKEAANFDDADEAEKESFFWDEEFNQWLYIPAI